MPNWNIHIEVGKRISKKLKLSNENRELFMFGNILPDINNGHLVKNISKIYDHWFTHYKVDDTYTYLTFYNKYKSKFKDNYLIVGYFAHLYTDYIWNNNFYSQIFDYEEYKCLDKESLKLLKQADFKVYDDMFNDNNFIINNIDIIIDKLNDIENVSIIRDDIYKVIDYLNNKTISNKKFVFYKKEDLDILLEETINKIYYFLKDILL